MLSCNMYTREKYNIRPVPLLALAGSIVLLFLGMYIEASLAGTFGSIFSFTFTGIQIDPDKMQYRKYDKILWFYIGTWHPINNPLYVTVVRIKLSGKRMSPLPMATAEEGNAARTYKINIIVDSRERYISISRGARMAMLEEGVKIARCLGVRLLDHSTSEKRWIKLE